MVTVARFLLFCPRASEQRVLHTEVVDLPCPPLSAQGGGDSLLWLMFVALSADPAPRNHVSNLRGRTLLRFTTRVSFI